MIAGRLNKRITIEHPEGMADNFLGEETPGKKKFLTVRADVIWASGNRVKADEEISYDYNVTFNVWIHLHGRIKEGDIVKYAGGSYQIVSLMPIPEARMLQIRAVTI